jgi:hypothetical protein
MYQGSGQATPCSQSWIGQDPCLGRESAAQVTAAVVLSVVVRLGPIRTFVDGTLVARPVRMTWHTLAPVQLDRRSGPSWMTTVSLTSRYRNRSSLVGTRTLAGLAECCCSWP